MADQDDRSSGQLGTGEQPVSFVKEAFKWQYNLIALAAAGAFALLSVSGLPLILAAGVELIYLSTVPNMPRFQRLVRSWRYEDEKKQQESKLAVMVRELPRELSARYADVCSVCFAIRSNYSKLSSTSQIFVGQMDQKLNGLAHSYLRLLYASRQHREYLRSTDTGIIRRELADLQKGLANDSPKVQEINRKRIEILTKRLEKCKKIAENLDVIDAQCAAIEDVLHLMRDQSITLRDPQQMSNQLESLLQDAEQTEQNVRDVEEIFQMATPDELEPGINAAGLQAPTAPIATETPSSSAQAPRRERTRDS